MSAQIDQLKSTILQSNPSMNVTDILNFTNGEIDEITAGGKPGAIDRAYAIYKAKDAPATKAEKPDKIRELAAIITKPTAKAGTAKPIPKAAPTPTPKNVLKTYQAMAPGAAKRAFLREHAVAIQSLSKSTK